MQSMQPLLKVENLSKTFVLHTRGGKRIKALENISFTLAEGEILALAGKSGAGKSSLMKCVYRTYVPTTGRILFRTSDAGFTDLAAASEHEILQIRKQALRYCSQFLQVIPRVPATEVVAESLLSAGVGRAEALSKAEKLLGALKLPRELWDAYPATFSGGEQQRINMARALISRARLLLVDEPTASLDAASKEIVIEMLLNMKSSGIAIILISHDEQTLARLADRRLYLEAGQSKEYIA
jgi:alpha-D-ribose 1-methylphosphonate 5-triphosphate synthase subunit PhnL